MDEDKIIGIAAGIFALLILVLIFPFPSMDKECLKPYEHQYLIICCKGVADVDGDGYITFEENNLGYGDFAMLHNAETKSCSCSGFHPQRYCYTTLIWTLIKP